MQDFPKNPLEMDKKEFECKRCGRCCRDFGFQIHYVMDPIDEFWKNLEPFYRNIIASFNNSFFNNTPEYPFKRFRPKRCFENHKKIYFIPTKLEYLVMVISSEFRANKICGARLHKYFQDLIRFSETPEALECIFLTKVDGLDSCSNYNNRPSMCRSYPRNKGYVCINQRERYFTHTYLQFKKNQFKTELEVLKENCTYFSDHDMDHAWDLIAFLMDFGEFPYDRLKQFFILIGWREIDFKYTVKDFMRYGLIYPRFKPRVGELLSCISSTAILHKVRAAKKQSLEENFI